MGCFIAVVGTWFIPPVVDVATAPTCFTEVDAIVGAQLYPLQHLHPADDTLGDGAGDSDLAVVRHGLHHRQLQNPRGIFEDVAHGEDGS